MKAVQYSVTLPIIFSSAMMVLAFTYWNSGQDFPRSVLALSELGLLLCCLLFYRLKITIDSEVVRITLGIGLFQKTIRIASITSVKPVRNAHLIGLGIRYTKGFVLYSVDGSDAVEFTISNSNYKIRIGTNVPEQISSYLAEMLKRGKI